MDMKGFFVCVFVIVLCFVCEFLIMLVYFVFSYDEEVGCLGVLGLMEVFGVEILCLCIVIVGEFIDMKVVNVYKGIVVFCIWIIGKEVYLSVIYKGVNVVFVVM